MGRAILVQPKYFVQPAVFNANYHVGFSSNVFDSSASRRIVTDQNVQTHYRTRVLQWYVS